MGDENPIHTLGDHSKPSHEGYRNTIELPVGNNVVPLRSDIIRLVQNECSFHGLRYEDPNQHLKDFLKLLDSLDLDGENRERTRLRLFQFSLRDQASRKTGLVYDQEEGTVTFEKDNEKITFKMPPKIEAFNHIEFKDVNTDSIPPFVLENNDDRGKTYYLDSLTLGPKYREHESISKEIRHLMKLEREAKRYKGEVT
ncbi:hypothetical protein Tco_0763629 [Tanacetum coccineum]